MGGMGWSERGSGCSAFEARLECLEILLVGPLDPAAHERNQRLQESAGWVDLGGHRESGTAVGLLECRYPACLDGEVLPDRGHAPIGFELGDLDGELDLPTGKLFDCPVAGTDSNGPSVILVRSITALADSEPFSRSAL